MTFIRRLLRDRALLIGLIIVGTLVLAAILANQLATFPGAISGVDPAHRLLPPDATYWLGTDRVGSDIYSRLLFGARLTILIAVLATAIAVLIGVPVGLVAGYYHGAFSDLLMRVSDVFLAVPQIVLAIAIAQTLGPAIQNVILALSVTYWPFWARLVYAETRSVRNEVFIESAIAHGRFAAAGDAAARHPVDRLFDHRPDQHRHGGHHPGRRLARLSGARSTPSDTGMGKNDRRKP